MNLQNQINYLKEYHGTDMFDNCYVPAPLDMERVRGAIVMRCGLMWPLFSEPETQQFATQQFFFENQWNFEHIIKIMQAEYSPIENVAEWRNESTKNTGADTLTITRNNTEAHTGTDGRVIQESGETREQEGGATTTQESGTTGVQESGTTTDREGGTTTTTREISAENASTYQADNRETVQHGKTDTTTHGRGETTTHGKGENITHGRSDTTTHGKRTEDDFTHGHVIDNNGKDQHVNEKDSETTYNVFRHGNVGVTTNQQMINEELDLLNRFNPYRFIADLYEKELMLGLY